MALTKCPDCGNEMRVQDKACPSCDNPFTSTSCGASTTMIVIIIAIVVFIGLIALTCA